MIPLTSKISVGDVFLNHEPAPAYGIKSPFYIKVVGIQNENAIRYYIANEFGDIDERYKLNLFYHNFNYLYYYLERFSIKINMYESLFSILEHE